MSKHDFTTAEFESRRSRVRAELRARKLDWLIAIHPVSIHWLTGSDAKSYQEFQCLFFPASPGPLTILTRQGECDEFEVDAWVDEVVGYGGGENEDPIGPFERVANRLGVLRGAVGLEVPAYYLHPHHYGALRSLLGSALMAEPTNLIGDLKLVKSPAEQAYIREAAARADRAQAAFEGALRAGATELELAGVVCQSLLSQGSFLAASPLNLVTGDRSCFSHGAPTGRRLQRGDFGNIEFGATCNRYTSTLGRNFCLGEPTPRMRELQELVLAASEACRAEIRAGVPATRPHAAAKRLIAAAGLEHGRVHTTGYGLAPGFPPTWGEPLHMLADSRYTLEAGMVLSVEPPVYLGKERLGARLIDNVLVTETGCEILSQHPRDLFIAEIA
ncbi:MAG TPA: aminopeptidase P family protein [Planctomycetaceae bacterium]|jgi:Xaa-Pro dipeptidase|nr:aminopeptidase P family protein [Planctomycetaceae bacterium]